MELNIHVTTTVPQAPSAKDKSVNERHMQFRSRHSRNGSNNKKGKAHSKDDKSGLKKRPNNKDFPVKGRQTKTDSVKITSESRFSKTPALSLNDKSKNISSKKPASVLIKNKPINDKSSSLPKNQIKSPEVSDKTNSSPQIPKHKSTSNDNNGDLFIEKVNDNKKSSKKEDEVSHHKNNLKKVLLGKKESGVNTMSDKVSIKSNEIHEGKKNHQKGVISHDDSDSTKKQQQPDGAVVVAGGGSRKRPAREHVDFYESEYHMSVEKLSQNAHAKPTKSKTSEHIFVKTQDFASLNIHEKLVGILKLDKEKGGFGLEHPTYVQRISVGSLSQGKSAFIKSQTGSGKTLAFLLPVVHRLVNIEPRPSRNDGTLALIIAPTRELCTQIYEVLVMLLKPFIWLVPGLISGGERKKSEKGRIRKGISCLVATPGRLLDHLQSTESFKVNGLKAFMLDEVDRLLDMGFDKQIKEIMKLLLNPKVNVGGAEEEVNSNLKMISGLNDAMNHRSEVQTILTSATTTASVQALLKEYVHHYEYFDADDQQQQPPSEGGSGTDGVLKKQKGIESPERAFSTTYDIPKQLSQHSMVVTYKLRLPALCATLRYCYEKKVKVVVFVATTSSADFLDALFKKAIWPSSTSTTTSTTTDKSKDSDIEDSDRSTFFHSWPCFRLHGDVPQKERSATIKKFHKLSSGLMLCTDVASRGLDMPHIDWIVQYDPPCEISDYVHRIGRTARKGQHGSSLIFLSPNEQNFLDILCSKQLVIKPLSLEASFERAFQTKNNVSESNKSSAFRTVSGEEGGGGGGLGIDAKITPISLQEYLELFVDQDEKLKVAASSAYQNFVRAYPIHASEIKACFQIRALHLGHVARSFALRHAPTDIKKMVSKKKSQKNSFEKKEKESSEKREKDIEEKGTPKKKKVKSSETLTDI